MQKKICIKKQDRYKYTTYIVGKKHQVGEYFDFSKNFFIQNIEGILKTYLVVRNAYNLDILTTQICYLLFDYEITIKEVKDNDDDR